MKYVFEAIKNKFHESGHLRRMLREVKLATGEGDDRPQTSLPILVVRKTGGERFPTDSTLIQRYDLEFKVCTKFEKHSVKDSIDDCVQAVINHFHEQQLKHPLFRTVEMFLSNDPQPELFDAAYEADLNFELTVAWQADESELRYV